MRIAIYARFSSDNQRHESIDAQVRAIDDYCTKNGYTIVKTYIDEAKSATSDNRPQFQQMIKDAELDIFDAVIVHKLDRFARDRYDSAYYKRKLKNCGIKLLSVTENLDGSPESIILESMLEGMAEYYSKNLAREVIKGLTENALKCKHTGGKPPFGYNVTPDKEYIINKTEALAIREIFTQYASGKSYADILNYLNTGGYRTKYNNKFTKTSLFNIFHNEKYKGTYVYNRFKRTKKNGITIDIENPSNEVIRVENGVPAIVDVELWELVQKKMKSNSDNMRSNRAKEQYLLTGKLYCGKCGKKMIGNRAVSHGGTSYHSGYYCSGKKSGNGCSKKGIEKLKIENKVLNYLDQNIFNEFFIHRLAEQVYNEYLSYTSVSKSNISAFKDKLKEINKKIQKYIEAIEDGLYSQAIKNRMQELDLQRVEVENMIAEEKYKDSNKYDLKEIEEFISSGKNLMTKSFEEKSKIINIFVDKIYLYDDKFKIDYFIDLSEDNFTAKPIILDLAVEHSPSSPLKQDYPNLFILPKVFGIILKIAERD